MKDHLHLPRQSNCPLLFVFFILTLTIMHTGKYAGAEETALQPDVLNTTNKAPKTRNDEPLSEKKINELLSLPYLQGYARAPKHTNTVLYKKRFSESGSNLYLSSGNSEIFLIDMKGNVLHTWHTPDHVPYSLTSNALLLRNGEIILSLGYKGVVKMDKHSNTLWSYSTDPHHDLDIDPEGNIYLITAMRRLVSGKVLILGNFIEVINLDGEFVKKIPLYNLFQNYKDQTIFRGMIRTPVNAPFNNTKIDDRSAKNHTAGKEKQHRTNRNIRKKDLFHANSVQWLFGPKVFRRGQHDAQLLPNGNMLIFNNYSSFEQSRVTEFDPVTHAIIWEYSSDDSKSYSSVLGGAQRLPGGNTIIVQSTSGRVFEVTPQKNLSRNFTIRLATRTTKAVSGTF